MVLFCSRCYYVLGYVQESGAALPFLFFRLILIVVSRQVHCSYICYFVDMMIGDSIGVFVWLFGMNFQKIRFSLVNGSLSKCVRVL